MQLEAKDEADLRKIIEKCLEYQLLHTVFREPDIGNQITAIAIEPSKLTKKVVSNLPILFKNKTIQHETK